MRLCTIFWRNKFLKSKSDVTLKTNFILSQITIAIFSSICQKMKAKMRAEELHVTNRRTWARMRQREHVTIDHRQYHIIYIY